MVAVGGMDITGSTPGFDTSTPEANGTEDNYVYNFDLTATPTLNLSADFEPFFGTEFNYYFDPPFVFPAGTFVLSPTDGSFTYDVTLSQAVAASMTSVTFSITGWQDLGGPVDSDTDTITFNFVLCFASGTLIATPGGEQNVEELAPGDLVTTADGREVPVKWIGRSAINPMFNPAHRLEPVLIRAGALGPGTPHTDLIVTADHGMVLDGYVINASALVNGSTIQWHDWKHLGETITYYHVETEAHDVILANGAASETYLDIPDRASFDNHAEYAALYGEETAIAESAMPRISSARLLPETVRARLPGTGQRAGVA